MSWVCISSHASAHRPTPIAATIRHEITRTTRRRPRARHHVDHLDRDVRVGGDQHAGDHEGQPDQAEPRQLAGPRPAVDRQVALRGLEQHQAEDQQQRGDADGQLDRGQHPADPSQPAGGSGESRPGPAAAGVSAVTAANVRSAGNRRQGVAIVLPDRLVLAPWPGPTIYDVATAAAWPPRPSRGRSPARRGSPPRPATGSWRSPRSSATAPTRTPGRCCPGKHHTVAMVVSDITNPHYFELIRGAEMRARVSEYTLLLVNAEESPRIEWEQIQRLSPAVDGFVLAASRLPDENLQQIAAQRPVVLMSRELPGPGQRGPRPRRGLPPDRRAPGLARSPRPALPRRSAQLLDGRHPLGGAAVRRPTQVGMGVRRIGPFTPKVTQGGAAADGAAQRRRHGDRRPQRPARDRRHAAARAARRPRARRTSAWSASTTSSPPTSARPGLTTLGGAHVDVGRAAVELLLTAGVTRGRRPARRWCCPPSWCCAARRETWSVDALLLASVSANRCVSELPHYPLARPVGVCSVASCSWLAAQEASSLRASELGVPAAAV